MYRQSTLEQLAQATRDKEEMFVALSYEHHNPFLVDYIRNSYTRIDKLMYIAYGVPRPNESRVPYKNWINDPKGAAHQQDDFTKKDEDKFERNSLIGVGILALLPILLAILNKANLPIVSGAAGIIGMLFGQQNPTEIKVGSTLTTALETYKVKDPNWRENPVFEHISDMMPTAEKDYIKAKIKKKKKV